MFSAPPKGKKAGPLDKIPSEEWLLKVVKREMLIADSMTEDVKHHLAIFCWKMGRKFFEGITGMF